MKPKKKIEIKPKVKIQPKKKEEHKVAHKVKKTDDDAPKKPEHKVAHKVKKSDDLPPEVKTHYDDTMQVKSFKEEAPPRDTSEDADPLPAE